ncbi:short chain oxidoreductase [Dentipellis sp. KUC8613]|nr:short chain oxidoreductase [Dentipellis sp. KUC8613]
MSASKLVALVTGAGQGIGRAIALRLSSDGYRVALSDISSNRARLEAVVDEVKHQGGTALPVYADVSQEGEVQGLVEETVGNLGSLDVMVANAAVVVQKEFLETTVKDVDFMHAVNVRGPFLCYKYAAKQMIAQNRGGRIIGACSNAGKKGMIHLGAYSASKFAVRGLTQVAAIELGKYGITVNAYAPGPTRTDMFKNGQASYLGTPAEFEAMIVKGSALGHIGEPEDLASLVSFFASENARHITGQTINVDGGREFD